MTDAITTGVVVRDGRGRASRWLLRGAALLATILLLYWAFHDVPLLEILGAVRRLRLWQLALIAGLNIVFHLLIGLRWWVVTHSDVAQSRLLEMAAIRIAGFALSYLTPGPQLGGEPLLVLYLRRRGASLARATATVIMDKLLELLTNFVFLMLGGLLVMRTELPGLMGAISPVALAVIGLLLTWPAIHVLLLWRGHHPASAVIQCLGISTAFRSLARGLRASEYLAGRFCRRRPRSLLAGIGFSLLAGAVVVMEYDLITSFLGMGLTLREIVAAWMAGWLSFVIPVPGALGALETSQVLALGAFGVPAASALALALVLRARDLAFSGLGLVFAARILAAVKANTNGGATKLIGSRG